VVYVVKKIKRGCPLGLTFFGLTSEHKVLIHQSIFALLYSSNGGFTFDQVYKMPIYLRNFYLKQLEEAKQKEMDTVKRQSKAKPSSKR
jgi:hypothetical protein